MRKLSIWQQGLSKSVILGCLWFRLRSLQNLDRSGLKSHFDPIFSRWILQYTAEHGTCAYMKSLQKQVWESGILLEDVYSHDTTSYVVSLQLLRMIFRWGSVLWRCTIVIANATWRHLHCMIMIIFLITSKSSPVPLMWVYLLMFSWIREFGRSSVFIICHYALQKKYYIIKKSNCMIQSYSLPRVRKLVYAQFVH